MSIANSIRAQIPPVHPEGYPFIGGFALASLILFWIWTPLGWIGTGLTVWCALFFRDPVRVTPVREGIVVSPADGRVVATGTIDQRGGDVLVARYRSDGGLDGFGSGGNGTVTFDVNDNPIQGFRSSESGDSVVVALDGLAGGLQGLGSGVDRERFGCSIGAHMGDTDYVVERLGLRELMPPGKHPWCEQWLPNTACAMVAQHYDLRGPRLSNSTACASGTNRYCATPLRKNIGRNTTQMHSTATKAGTTICCAPSRIAVVISLPCSR